jgi:hypothetical protein
MVPLVFAEGDAHVGATKLQGFKPEREELSGGNQLVTESVAPIVGTADSPITAAT